MAERLVRARQIAERLGIGTRRVYELANAGVLPVVRLGPHAVRFDPAAIERWIAAGGMPQVQSDVAQAA